MSPAANSRLHARRAAAVAAAAWLAVAAAGAAMAASASHPHAPAAGFAIGGRVSGRLVPGARLPIDLRLINRRHFALRITRLAVSVRAVTTRPGCSGRNFRVLGFRGRYPIRLPGGRSRTLAQLGYPTGRWPRVEMLETHRDQDACAGARITLVYSGSARRTR
jgi:hypothetical protein